MSSFQLPRAVVALSAVALAAVACGQGASQRSDAGQAGVVDIAAEPSPAGDAAAPDGIDTRGDSRMREVGDATGLQPDASDMEVVVRSPRPEQEFEGLTLPFEVAVQGFTFSPELAGKHPVPGTGHYHLYLDDALYDMFFTSQGTISLRNLEPGTHTLRVVPAQNDHVEITANGDEVSFEYDPKSPPPLIRPARFAGQPSIRIISPQQGDVVADSFDLVVEVDNLNLSCDLMGRPDVAGYGHWHVNLDNEQGGLGGLLGMACQRTFKVSTAGLRLGSIHTFHATLTGNGHAPLGPRSQDAVQVRIGD